MTGRHAAQPEVVHIAGAFCACQEAMRGRQRCSWCGALLFEADIEIQSTIFGQRPVPAGEFFQPGSFVAIGSDAIWVIVPTDGTAPPTHACWVLDPMVTR